MSSYEAASNDGEDEKLPGIIMQVVPLIRGKVASCHEVLCMGPANTIPDELLWAAAAICKYSLALVIPGLSEEQDQMRQEEYRKAMSQLDQAARCELTVSSPSGSSQPTPSPSACGGAPLEQF